MLHGYHHLQVLGRQCFRTLAAQLKECGQHRITPPIQGRYQTRPGVPETGQSCRFHPFPPASTHLGADLPPISTVTNLIKETIKVSAMPSSSLTAPVPALPLPRESLPVLRLLYFSFAVCLLANCSSDCSFQGKISWQTISFSQVAFFSFKAFDVWENNRQPQHTAAHQARAGKR